MSLVKSQEDLDTASFCMDIAQPKVGVNNWYKLGMLPLTNLLEAETGLLLRPEGHKMRPCLKKHD